jgi:transcriptional regulator with XRE-family HTH domain
MGTKETRLQRGHRKGEDLTRATIAQLRDARIVAGLSQEECARQLGLSQSYISKLEVNGFDDLSLIRASELAALFGLEPSLTLHVAGAPLRDKGHEALLGRFMARLAPEWIVTREAPFPTPSDPRWWDALLRLANERYVLGVEAETRLRDMQAQVRRIHGRQRDGGADHVLVILSDSAHNRALAGDFRTALGPEFATQPREILRAMAAGTPLPGSGVILL